MAHAFGPFHFEGITVRLPSQTFSGRLDVSVGDRAISFSELGPAGGPLKARAAGEPRRGWKT